jgi:predicted DNA-binding transcriptional regulator AlpA
MTATRPLAVTERTAASMLDMPVAKFLRLVHAGACPPPMKIGDEVRWRVSDLEAILSGRAAQPKSDDME